MRRGLRRGLLVSIIAGVLGACGGETKVCLELSSQEPARILTRLPVKTGTPFVFEFVNSIYRSPVRETLVYNPAEGISIVMVESPCDGVFEYYGLEPDGTGRAVLNRRVGDIRIRSHDYKNHRIRAGGKTLHLEGLVANGEPLILKMRGGRECGKPVFSGGD